METKDVVVAIECPDGHRGPPSGVAKFCAYDGKPLSPLRKTRKQATLDPLSNLSEPPFWNLHEIGFEDEDIAPTEHVYASNLEYRLGDPRDFTPESECLQSFSANARASEIAWFVEKFGPEIDRLRKTYGAENVRIEWALARWWS
jgi:hypothetical protein